MRSTLFVAAAVCLLGLIQAENSEAAGKDMAVSPEGRGFWGVWRTATVATVSVTTSTSFFTCVSATATDACTGRRRRGLTERKLAIGYLKTPESVASVDSSLREKLEVETNDGTARDPRFVLSITTHSTTTHTITSTTINNALIVSVSIMCAVAGAPSFPACG